MRFWVSAVLAIWCTACGYHTSNGIDVLPKTVHTIAVPEFANLTTRYKLTDKLPEAIAREFIARTRYRVVPDAGEADAVLKGYITNYTAFPTVYDTNTGRATNLQITVTMGVSLTERTTGKVLYSRPSFEVKDSYEISIQEQQYFDESEVALDRLSRDAARTIVSAVLENF